MNNNIKKIEIDFEEKKVDIQYSDGKAECVLALMKSADEVLDGLGFDFIPMNDMRNEIDAIFDSLGLDGVRCARESDGKK